MGCGSSGLVEKVVSRESLECKSNLQVAKNNLNLGLMKPMKETESRTKKECAFSIGDKVHVSGYTGVVKLFGPLGDQGHEWVGIELDCQHPEGNDGCFQGVQHFTCKPKHGLFSQASSVFHYSGPKVSKDNVQPRESQKHLQMKEEIEAHVSSTPKEETESVERLSKYLTSPCEGERSKAYAIFRWVIDCVDYDAVGYFEPTKKKSSDLGSVLKHKCCDCAGYVNIFEALCKEAGLKVHTIEGYAKNYSHEPGKHFTTLKHAWNAVQVNAEWFICDPTWGAGFLGNDSRFHRNPNTNMFLMDPQYAICSHYPLDKNWQLLDQSISKEEFEKLVIPSERFHELGVKLLSHKECICNFDEDHAEMTFYSPSHKILRGELQDSAGEEIKGRERTQVISCGANIVKLRVDFPAPGQYKLCLYAREVTSTSDYKWCQGVEYVIHTSKGVGENRGGFPKLGNKFYEMGFKIESPLENILAEQGKATIIIAFENCNFQIFSISAELEILGAETKLEEKYDGFMFCNCEKMNTGYRILVHCPVSGEYILNVFAKHFEEGQSDTFVCSYHISALSGGGPIPGFPQMCDSFKSWELELIEPLQNIYVPDGKASVKIRAPEKVRLVGNLMRGKQHLDIGLCFSKKTDGIWTILVHAPEPGEFKLNIFGMKSGSQDNEHMATYMIKSDKAAGLNPGFPYLKDDFKEWGLELVEHSENIVSHDGQVTVTISHPSEVSIKCYLFDVNDTPIGYELRAETVELKTIVTCELPGPGGFKLNIFGTNSLLDSSKRVYLGFYKILYKAN